MKDVFMKNVMSPVIQGLDQVTQTTSAAAFYRFNDVFSNFFHILVLLSTLLTNIFVAEKTLPMILF